MLLEDTPAAQSAMRGYVPLGKRCVSGEHCVLLIGVADRIFIASRHNFMFYVHTHVPAPCRAPDIVQ